MRPKFIEKVRELLTNMESAQASETNSGFRQMPLQADPVRQELPGDYLQLAIQVQTPSILTESQSPVWQELPKMRLNFSTKRRPLSKWVTDPSLRNVKQLVSQCIGAVSGVIRVVGTLNEEEDVISVCTIIDSSDSLLRYRIYEAEEKVLDAVPFVSFDFRVVNLRNFPRADISSLSEVEGEVLYQVNVISNDEIAAGFSDLPKGASYAYTG